MNDNDGPFCWSPPEVLGGLARLCWSFRGFWRLNAAMLGVQTLMKITSSLKSLTRRISQHFATDFVTFCDGSHSILRRDTNYVIFHAARNLRLTSRTFCRPEPLDQWIQVKRPVNTLRTSILYERKYKKQRFQRQHRKKIKKWMKYKDTKKPAPTNLWESMGTNRDLRLIMTIN